MKILKSLKPILAFTFTVCCILLTTSCKTNKAAITSKLTGTWQEKESQVVVQFAGTGHYIKFFADRTFHLEQQLWTDMLKPDATCRPNRTDYIKGTYKLKGSTLKLRGAYCDKAFAIDKPNCNGEVSFTNSYEIEIYSEQIILDKNEEYPAAQILLIKQ